MNGQGNMFNAFNNFQNQGINNYYQGPGGFN